MCWWLCVNEPSAWHCLQHQNNQDTSQPFTEPADLPGAVVTTRHDEHQAGHDA